MHDEKLEGALLERFCSEWILRGICGQRSSPLSRGALPQIFFWLAASSTDLWIDTQDWGFCGGGTQTGRVAALGVRYQIDPNHLSGIIRSIWALRGLKKLSLSLSGAKKLSLSRSLSEAIGRILGGLLCRGIMEIHSEPKES